MLKPVLVEKAPLGATIDPVSISESAANLRTHSEDKLDPQRAPPQVMNSHRIWLVLGMALVRCRTSETVPFHPAGPLAGRQPALTFTNQRTTHFPVQAAPGAAMLRDRRAGTMARYTRDREDMAKTLSFLRKLDDIYSQISRPRSVLLARRASVIIYILKKRTKNTLKGKEKNAAA